MKQSLPAFASTFFKGLRTLLFHPMLYIAILLHWGLFNLPSPIEQSEENEEELLDESIPIASSASLGVKSKNKPKSNDKQNEDKKKEKPKPLAEALVQSDPELAKLAEEKKRKQEEARKKAEELKKAEEAKKQAEAEKKNTDTYKKTETEASKIEKDLEKPGEVKTDESEPQDTDNNAAEGNIKDSEGDSSDSPNTTAQHFNLELLPNPELVFTPNSLAEYNPGFNALEFQSSVEDARTLETTTSIDKAIQAITALPEFQDFSFSDPIFDDRKDSVESGLGVVYAIQLADKTKYVSFIRRSSRWARKNKKNTLRSTTVFVLWSENPLS